MNLLTVFFGFVRELILRYERAFGWARWIGPTSLCRMSIGWTIARLIGPRGFDDRS